MKDGETPVPEDHEVEEETTAPKRMPWKLDLRLSGIVITLGALAVAAAIFLAVIFIAGNSDKAKFVHTVEYATNAVQNNDCKGFEAVTTAKLQKQAFGETGCVATWGPTPRYVVDPKAPRGFTVVSSKVDGDKATLVVTWPSNNSNAKPENKTYTFVKSGGTWKLDTLPSE